MYTTLVLLCVKWYPGLASELYSDQINTRVDISSTCTPRNFLFLMRYNEMRRKKKPNRKRKKERKEGRKEGRKKRPDTAYKCLRTIRSSQPLDKLAVMCFQFCPPIFRYYASRYFRFDIKFYSHGAKISTIIFLSHHSYTGSNRSDAYTRDLSFRNTGECSLYEKRVAKMKRA